MNKYDKSSNYITSIKVACHNINGIKNNRIKLKTLVEWSKKENVKVLGLVETNSNSKELRFSLEEKNFKGFWTQSMVIKRKGSSVGILVSQE